MLNDEQKLYLSKLPKAALVKFVAEVQGIDKLLDKKIERLLLQADKPKLIKKLTSNLKGLRRRHKYIEYWKLNEFLTELQYLVDDIMSLYPEQPAVCLELLELFIESTDSSIDRAEDANGEVVHLYNSLSQFWLTVASACYEQEKSSLPIDEQDILSQAWQEKVKTLIADNDHGTKNDLITGIRQLLSEFEIRDLIEGYEQYYKGLFLHDNDSDDDNSDDDAKAEQSFAWRDDSRPNHQEKLKTETVLIELASALGDISTFEDIYLKIYPNKPLNPQQLSRLLRFMMDQRAYEIALQYLNEQWSSANKRDQVKRLDWLNEIYRKQDNTEAQIQVLSEAFELHASPKRFRALMSITSPVQQAQWRKRTYKLAERQENIVLAVSLLLEINDTELANQIAVARHLEFADFHYQTLTQLLKELPEQTQLIQVIIYRSLIDDILSEGRSQAYGYAARYYKKLVQLDGRLNTIRDGYSSLLPHQDYVTMLNEQHSQKSNFWERINV